jgi:Ca2+-binding EF-hand superfamily protein
MKTSLRVLLAGVGFCVAASFPLALSTAAYASAESKLKAYDSDHDGTLDEKEVTAAAGTTFDALDTDHDGTLTIKELQGRLSKADFKAGDPDNDKTLSKDEFVAIVVKAFKSADPDSDGTLDAKEMKSKAGLVVVRLLK